MTAVIIAFTAWEPDVFICLKEVPIWPLTAGVMGAALVFGIAWVMPPTGAAKGFGLLIVGQVITGLTLSTSGTGFARKTCFFIKNFRCIIIGYRCRNGNFCEITR